MKKSAVLVIVFLVVLVLIVGVIALDKRKGLTPNFSPTLTATPLVTPSEMSSVQPTQSINAFAEPIRDFKSRVTKKPFGIYVTPQNSPVRPERFTGFHTGADVEYEDVTTDVPVYAIADCRVVLSQTASGYGGVFAVSFDLNGSTHTALYGHIRPSILPNFGEKFNRGEQIAVLGTGYSAETDGERQHLHFAILFDNSLDIKGYVQSKSELSGWIDPLTIF